MFMYEIKFVPKRDIKSWDDTTGLIMNVLTQEYPIETPDDAIRIARKRLKKEVRQPNRWKLAHCHIK